MSTLTSDFNLLPIQEEHGGAGIDSQKQNWFVLVRPAPPSIFCSSSPPTISLHWKEPSLLPPLTLPVAQVHWKPRTSKLGKPPLSPRCAMWLVYIAAKQPLHLCEWGFSHSVLSSQLVVRPAYWSTLPIFKVGWSEREKCGTCTPLNAPVQNKSKGT